MTASAPKSACTGGPGFYDLGSLAEARRLTDWMFSQFSALARGRVAEIGPGIGTFSERLLEHGVSELLLVEPDPPAAELLERRFGHDPHVHVAQETLPGAPALAQGGFDLVLCQNVLEHIEDDHGAAAEIAAAIAPGGFLGILVPAHPRLYSALDEQYGHHRRYSRRRVRELVQGAGLELVELHSFNLLGVAGWWAKKVSRSTTLDPGSLRIYEQLVRLWRPLEERRPPPWGLSLIAHARKVA